jgi:hypothetical protein
MRIDLQRALVALVPALLCMSGIARAQNYQFAGQQRPLGQVPSLNNYYAENNEGQNFLTGDTQAAPAAPAAPAAAPAMGDCACNDGDSMCASCQACPNRGLIVYSGYESWRGVSDGSYNNNNGGSTGFNYGTRLGNFSDMTGIGFQFGASYGIYDWNGRSSAPNNDTQAQTQLFITTGFFKKVNDTSNWSYGLIHDWMVNRNFGVEANNPTLGQWRGQISYATNAWNEIGAWGTLRDQGMSRSNDAGNAQVAYRTIDQIDFFWHHKYEFCGDSWVWFGLPQKNRLAGGGSLGDFIIGGTFTTPLNDYMSLYANMTYMHPTAEQGVGGSLEDAWFVGMGVAYYVGGYARTNTVAGNCWLPLMPMANNGNFLVDASSTR